MSQAAVISLNQVVCPTGGPFDLRIDQLTVRAGERIAIMGPNGAGKSTLFKLLSGFAIPTAGTASILGIPLHEPIAKSDLSQLRCSVGQVMQGLHLVQRLTVLENVLIGSLGRLTGWRTWARCYPDTQLQEAVDALQKVGLLSRSQARTDSLSGGERQKTAIARMLLQRPELILADEPTASLDPVAADEVCRLIVDSAGTAALISVIHNPSLLPLLASRAIGVKRGCIVFDVPVAAIDDARLAELYRHTGSALHHQDSGNSV